MKKYLLIILLPFLLFSCSSTKPFVNEVTLSDDLTLEEKLKFYGGVETTVSMPDMYFDGDEWLDVLTEEVKKAEDYILISVYLGTSSAEIENFYNTLCQKAEEGVRVYFMVDGSTMLDMTASRFYMTPLYFLREHGVNLLVYSPMSFTHALNPETLFVRDHRKMMVIDGKVAVVGGMNLNYIAVGAGEENQRDSMYLFHSANLASIITDEFVTSWNKSSIEPMNRDDFASFGDEGEYKAWLFNSDLDRGNCSISGMYGSLFNEAKESVFLCPFLPALNNNMLESIKKCTERGVDFEMWFSEDPRAYLKAGSSWENSKILDETSVEFYDVTFDENGERYPFYHMKMAVIDNRYLVVGSANFNYRSMALSHEIALVLDSPQIAEKAMEMAKKSGGNPIEISADEYRKKKEEYGSYLGFLVVFWGG